MTDRDFADLENFADGHGFLSWLDMDVVNVSSGRAVLRIPAAPQLRNVGQMDPPPIHGGVISTLVDTASSVSLRSTFEDPEHTGLTTTNMDVSYLRPATGDLEAVAEVVRAGTSMGVVEATVTSKTPDGDEVEVAVGTANFRIFRGGDQ